MAMGMGSAGRYIPCAYFLVPYTTYTYTTYMLAFVLERGGIVSRVPVGRESVNKRCLGSGLASRARAYLAHARDQRYHTQPISGEKFLTCIRDEILQACVYMRLLIPPCPGTHGRGIRYWGAGVWGRLEY